MTPEQLAIIKERAQAAYLPGELPTWADGDGYSTEYADGGIVAYFPTDTSGEGDYETYNRRQAAQLTFARHVREDVKALIAEVERQAAEVERQSRQIDDQSHQIDDLAGRLCDAAILILAVQDWDSGARGQGASSLRLHNAYREWQQALKKRDKTCKEKPHG